MLVWIIVEMLVICSHYDMCKCYVVPGVHSRAEPQFSGAEGHTFVCLSESTASVQ